MRAVLIVIVVLLISLIHVYGDEDFTEAIKLVEGNVPCTELTEHQLEEIGDYYMEQMHPGEAHEIMDKVMGGEGSESLKQMHIAIAKRIYCNDISGMVNYGYMGMMGPGYRRYTMGYGMMGYPGYGGMYGMSGFWWLGMLWWIVIIAAIIWFVYWLMRRSGNSVEIIKQRYARGEISKKEYERMKKDLMSEFHHS